MHCIHLLFTDKTTFYFVSIWALIWSISVLAGVIPVFLPFIGSLPFKVVNLPFVVKFCSFR